jgi:hypothetical protein
MLPHVDCPSQSMLRAVTPFLEKCYGLARRKVFTINHVTGVTAGNTQIQNNHSEDALPGVGAAIEGMFEVWILEIHWNIGFWKMDF